MNPLKQPWLALLLALWATAPRARADAYEEYVKHSEDFRPVKQDEAWAYKAFPSWTYMPWTFQWTIGYTDESGRWSVEHGYNGAFTDRGAIAAEGSPTGRLDWINKFGLRFYMDHSADKGYLHLWDGDKVRAHMGELHGTGLRPVPLNEATFAKLHGFLQGNINAVKSSPFRAAYALDDEASWGHFVHPTMWQITDDAGAYPKWLAEVYGAGAAPKRDRWISYEELRPKLPDWSIKEFDASPLMDQWTFNDAHWANYIGRLVQDANSLDPATPCGLVGGQSPSAFGGYDYARLMRKVQFLEAYNIGSSQAIIRSFNPHNALPMVTSAFHKSSADDIWQTWYYLAHGNRGHIGWVDGWFDGKTPKPWHDEVAPTYLEAGKKIGPLMTGAEWMHDGVALYYSHPSIQLGWILDAQAHGKTWVNRNNDDRLSSSCHVRHAWENMLRDEGIQYSYVSYVDLIQKGVPAEFKVLILDATLCLSDAEARAIKAFCERGGTVIADYLPGLWDQHGKGRQGGGALDDLFGVAQSSDLRMGDVFGGNLWVEVNQDANFGWKTYQEFLSNQNSCIRDDSGFNKAIRTLPVNHVQRHGRGAAILMNLSPQWYNAFRVAGGILTERRAAFMHHLTEAGVGPWVRIKGAGETEHGYEITYWKKPAAGKDGARVILFVCFNPEIVGNSLGGGNSQGLKTALTPITLQFKGEVKGLRDERTGKELGVGSEFPLQWKQNEALVLSFPAGAR